MIKQKLKDTLSLNGISILIGIVGGILGILSIFIDWNTQLSIKWFAALWITYSFILIISIKLVYDIYLAHKLRFNTNNKAIKYLSVDFLLLVQNNQNLEFSQSVSIYYLKDDFLLLMANGYVQNIQEKFVQIKIIDFNQDFTNPYKEEYEKIVNNNANALASVLIKNYISYNG